jgi:hypothetical protein
MAQESTTIPPHGYGKIQLSDFWKSLFLAAIVNILLGIYPIVSAGHWPTVVDLQSMVKSTVAIIIGYLIKNLSTNNVGEILTKDKPVVSVDSAALNKLQDKVNTQ